MEKDKLPAPNISSMYISRDTLDKLDALRITPRESYEEVILRVLKEKESI